MWEVRGVRLVTVQEFARLVGVSRRTIYRYIKEGLPVYASEGRYIIPYDEALKWMRKKGYPV